MHRPIVQIRADRCIHADDLSVRLLLISDEVLHAGDSGFLHASDSLKHELAIEIRIVREAFPVACDGLDGRDVGVDVKMETYRPPSATRPSGPTTGPSAMLTPLRPNSAP